MLLALTTALAVLVLAPSANAGRLIQSGHDIDYHCTVETNQCHFVQVALSYVRAGSPIPSKPILVLDQPGIHGTLVPQAIRKAFNVGTTQCPDSGTGTLCTVVDPSASFATTPNLDTAHYSAIWVGSDVNCGGCDLNSAPSGGAAQPPDSTAIYRRTDDIAAFFNAGGGL